MVIVVTDIGENVLPRQFISLLISLMILVKLSIAALSDVIISSAVLYEYAPSQGLKCASLSYQLPVVDSYV
jgi:hypothetical protein